MLVCYVLAAAAGAPVYKHKALSALILLAAVGAVQIRSFRD